jgi:hypothetical protein
MLIHFLATMTANANTSLYKVIFPILVTTNFSHHNESLGLTLNIQVFLPYTMFTISSFKRLGSLKVQVSKSKIRAAPHPAKSQPTGISDSTLKLLPLKSTNNHTPQ